MNPYSIQFMAEERIAELHREAAQERLARIARQGRSGRVSPLTLLRRAIDRLVWAPPALPGGAIPRPNRVDRRIFGGPAA